MRQRQLLAGKFAGAVVAAREFADAGRVEVEADHREMPAEMGGERQPDVAEADHGNAAVRGGGQDDDGPRCCWKSGGGGVHHVAEYRDRLVDVARLQRRVNQ